MTRDVRVPKTREKREHGRYEAPEGQEHEGHGASKAGEPVRYDARQVRGHYGMRHVRHVRHASM